MYISLSLSIYIYIYIYTHYIQEERGSGLWQTLHLRGFWLKAKHPPGLGALIVVYFLCFCSTGIIIIIIVITISISIISSSIMTITITITTITIITSIIIITIARHAASAREPPDLMLSRILYQST